jgi:hypothetical protein
MDPFCKILGEVCKRPGMYVGYNDFILASRFLIGYDMAIAERRPDLGETALSGFTDWLAVRLDSCVKSHRPEILLREDIGPDKFEALLRLYDEFTRDRNVRGLNAILADFKELKRATWAGRARDCWCALPPVEWDEWRPSKRAFVNPPPLDGIADGL